VKNNARAMRERQRPVVDAKDRKFFFMILSSWERKKSSGTCIGAPEIILDEKYNRFPGIWEACFPILADGKQALIHVRVEELNEGGFLKNCFHRFPGRLPCVLKV